LVVAPNEVNEYRERFFDLMTFVARVFPYGFRTSKKGITTRKARFEAIAVGSYLALKERPELASLTPAVDWLSSEEFQEVTGSDGANAIGRLKARFNFVKDRLLEN
ncbi:MAG: DUF262 domain-containing protein, partial [Nitrospirota bacterium]